MLSALRLSTALLLVALTCPAPAIAADEQPDIYILAGQSNMSGRGALDDLSAGERAVDPAIQLFGNDGQERPATEPLDDAAGQLDAVSADRMAAVGPGLFFARALHRLNDRPILLVPCAKGGSSMAEWRPADSRNTLYGSCLARVREANGRLAGVLWYQGETDADKPTAIAADWSRGFRELVARFRSDAANPTVPVVMVQLSDRPDAEANRTRFANWSLVQEQQGRVDLPCTSSVSARSLPRNADDLHLSTAGQRRLGDMLASAMDDLHRRGCH
ncbi:sialate O-acetylesterase [Croceibacterium sp. TMG7-5b_MA50]|uniref:sialate O-acetylesterase n=1 Tax=Croceibacterium sp. TMG7-5b_MA50 TaxID=3121290 RepID=UPI003222175E